MDDTADPAAGTEDPAVPGTDARYALEALEHDWGGAYHIEFTAEDGWRAKRLDGLGGRITAAGPDELWAAMAADYDMKPVPRGMPGGAR